MFAWQALDPKAVIAALRHLQPRDVHAQMEKITLSEMGVRRPVLRSVAKDIGTVEVRR